VGFRSLSRKPVKPLLSMFTFLCIDCFACHKAKYQLFFHQIKVAALNDIIETGLKLCAERADYLRRNLEQLFLDEFDNSMQAFIS